MSDNNTKTRLTGFQINPQNINKDGRPPKEFSITNAFREILSDQNPETKIERYKELLNKALTMAMRGDGDMIKYIINRLEGMPKGSETNVAIQVNNFSMDGVWEGVRLLYKQSNLSDEEFLRRVKDE